jgi:hypothetical protein
LSLRITCDCCGQPITGADYLSISVRGHGNDPRNHGNPFHTVTVDACDTCIRSGRAVNAVLASTTRKPLVLVDLPPETPGGGTAPPRRALDLHGEPGPAAVTPASQLAEAERH